MSGEVGRPTTITPEVLQKLEEAFLLGCTDSEACLYANVGKSTLYAYQKDHPEFQERKEELKENPFLVARTTVVKSLKSNPEIAKWYLERKKKAEFAQRQEVTGAEGQALTVTIKDYAFDGELDKDQPKDSSGAVVTE